MNRTYNQGCLLAYALDNLGERWTLLIIRDLLLGPRGFADLQKSLDGIGGSLLTKRLRDLEELQIITNEEGDGRRGRYRLTELGESLRPTVRSFMAWTMRFMKKTASREVRSQIAAVVNKPDSVALGIEIYADENRDPSLSYIAQLVIDDRSYAIYYMAGEMTVKRGGDTPASVSLETDLHTVLEGLKAEIDADTVRTRSTTSGDEKALRHLLSCIALKPRRA